MKIKIFGAGSIGNHLAHACRWNNWEVTICDSDAQALERTKTSIYPGRYGRWDETIRLLRTDEPDVEKYDLVIIGTPPDSHMALAFKVMKTSEPKVILIEKPLCTPSLDGCDELLDLAESTGITVLVGYNHTLTENSTTVADLLKDSIIGTVLTISAGVREHWGGILSAHPWLDGPKDSYLGYSERGGGACGEHSHSINIWQYFAHLAGAGRVNEVSAVMDVVDDGIVKYDRLCQISLKTENGLVGLIVQDVITKPPQKSVRIQGDIGFIDWYVNYDASHDAVRYGGSGLETVEKLISKTRPDDFKSVIGHIEKILEGESLDSPIRLERGLESMMVIAGAYLSHDLGRTVKIDYEKGFNYNALNPV